MTLIDYLKQDNIAVSDFARKVGRDPSVVARWKRGDTMPDSRIWSVIEKATGGRVKPSDLLVSLLKKDRAA